MAGGLGGVPGGVVPGISLGGVTSFVTREPRKKGPLVGLGYIGDEILPSYIGIIITEREPVRPCNFCTLVISRS